MLTIEKHYKAWRDAIAELPSCVMGADQMALASPTFYRLFLIESNRGDVFATVKALFNAGFRGPDLVFK